MLLFFYNITKEALYFISGLNEKFGNWTNQGSCKAIGEDPSWGPGNQLQQMYRCITEDYCFSEDRTIPCREAAPDTSLPLCKSALFYKYDSYFNQKSLIFFKTYENIVLCTLHCFLLS